MQILEGLQMVIRYSPSHPTLPSFLSFASGIMSDRMQAPTPIILSAVILLRSNVDAASDCEPDS